MKPRSFALGLGALLLLLLAATAAGGAPHNVIVMIADGMGPEHTAAARAYKGAPLVYESAPNSAQMTTQAVDLFYNLITTDSGASATAMATGRKVWFTVISKAIPGEAGTPRRDQQARHGAGRGSHHPGWRRGRRS